MTPEAESRIIAFYLPMPREYFFLCLSIKSLAMFTFWLTAGTFSAILSLNVVAFRTSRIVMMHIRFDRVPR